MRRLLALLLFSAAAALAAASFNLTVPGEGPYKLWMAPTFPAAAPKDAQLIEKSPTPVSPPGSGYMAVLDTQSGNLAVKPVKGLKGDVNLTTADFSLIGEVKIEVSHEGKPVQTANVTLSDGNKPQSAILDPSLGGAISFYGVRPGRVEIKVQYVSNGKQALDDRVADLTGPRTQATPLIKVAIADDVATVDAAALGTPGLSNTQPGSSPAPKPQMTPTTVVGKTVAILFGLVLAGGIGYALFWLWRAHPTAVADKLTSLGVQIPKDPNEAMDLSPVQPAAPVRPDPPQKIILEDSDPTPLAPTAGAVPLVSVASGPPSRLVAETGGAMSLADGATLIGRDATLGVTVPDPSTLSRRHAEVVRQGDHLLVRDLGSTNGTYVNGRKIDSDTPLMVGDSVQFGAVRFRVEA
ncbi:MAG: FHA domain-containing protein [Fimbriimonadaceae bacterium]